MFAAIVSLCLSSVVVGSPDPPVLVGGCLVERSQFEPVCVVDPSALIADPGALVHDAEFVVVGDEPAVFDVSGTLFEFDPGESVLVMPADSPGISYEVRCRTGYYACCWCEQIVPAQPRGRSGVQEVGQASRRCFARCRRTVQSDDQCTAGGVGSDHCRIEIEAAGHPL